MKKHDLFQLALMVCSFSEVFLNAQQKKNIKAIEPMVDFRVPRSLMESMQEGINGVYASLQTDTPSKTALQEVDYELSRLLLLYENDLNTTRKHHVNDDDKAFLQKMIDRIDQIIAQLEETEESENSSEYRSIRMRCQELKHKIS